MRNSRLRDDAGAVAVLVALLSIVLFAAAALSVDIGNAWARRRQVQTSVDVSALSAGHLLPWASATDKNSIASEVASYLAENPVHGQTIVTASDLLDGDQANGELVFPSSDEFTVVAPRAWVNFGLGRALKASLPGVNVSASATVRVFSPLPPKSKVFPFAMPASCPFGPAMADASAGGPKADTSGSEYSGTNSPVGHVDTVTPTALTFGSTNPQDVTVTVSSLPKKATSIEVLFANGGATESVTASITETSLGDTRTVTVSVPAPVLDTPGTWNVWGVIKNQSTTNSVPVMVGDGDPDALACADGDGGQFGQMYSPRGDSAADQQGFALNIAAGLDHDIVPWTTATPEDCGTKNDSPPTGGVDDLPHPATTPNCVLAQDGNDGPWMYKGLISGKDLGVPGRLSAANGATSCGSDAARDGFPLNNDYLSCFVAAGHSLDELTASSGNFDGILNPNVVDSPRFVWIPVVSPTTRNQINNSTFYPIERFVPGFITDETDASGASSNNGVVTNGNSVKSIQVFTFNPLALPISQQSPVTAYDPQAGKTVRLVH